MSYTTSTPIKGTSRGDPAKITAWAKARGCARPADVAAYLDTLYRLCRSIGLSAHVLVAQSIHETSEDGVPWASYWWQERLNPAGIGITGDTAQNNASRTFADGAAAARAHVLHMYLYAVGTDIPTGLSKQDDPRWQAAVNAGRAGIAPTINGLTRKWGTDPDYATGIAKWLNALDGAGLLTTTTTTPAPKPTGDTNVPTTNPAVVFGNIEKFGYMDLQDEMANKPEGVGWDNLGKRDMLGLVLHRMYGTLNGTRYYFADPGVGALTDFAVGVEAIDGKANAGVIQQYNDPFGYRSGWASGRVSAPYGDGVLFVNKYGVNAVNKRLTSLEISGYENTPIDDFAWGEIVHFVAYWADQCHISYEQFPINPATGISFLYWHQEFTIGTGKLCPWNVVMSRTNELIEDVKAMLKAAQTGGQVPSEEEPGEEEPVPTPKYANPVPITELAMMADRDFAGSKPYRDIVRDNGEKLRVRVVLDKVKVTNPDTFYQQYAIAGGKRTKPDPKVGDLVDVVYSCTGDDGNEYWIDPQWARIAQDKAVLYED